MPALVDARRRRGGASAIHQAIVASIPPDEMAIGLSP